MWLEGWGWPALELVLLALHACLLGVCFKLLLLVLQKGLDAPHVACWLLASNCRPCGNSIVIWPTGFPGSGPGLQHGLMTASIQIQM